MRKMDIETIIDTLRDEELLALLGIARSLIGQSYAIIKDAFEEYKKMCDDYSVSSHRITCFRKYIQRFIRLNLIVCQLKKDKEYQGRFLKITKLNIPSKDIIKALNNGEIFSVEDSKNSNGNIKWYKPILESR